MKNNEKIMDFFNMIEDGCIKDKEKIDNIIIVVKLIKEIINNPDDEEKNAAKFSEIIKFGCPSDIFKIDLDFIHDEIDCNTTLFEKLCCYNSCLSCWQKFLECLDNFCQRGNEE